MRGCSDLRTRTWGHDVLNEGVASARVVAGQRQDLGADVNDGDGVRLGLADDTAGGVKTLANDAVKVRGDVGVGFGVGEAVLFVRGRNVVSDGGAVGDAAAVEDVENHGDRV